MRIHGLLLHGFRSFILKLVDYCMHCSMLCRKDSNSREVALGRSKMHKEKGEMDETIKVGGGEDETDTRRKKVGIMG